MTSLHNYWISSEKRTSYLHECTIEASVFLWWAKHRGLYLVVSRCYCYARAVYRMTTRLNRKRLMLNKISQLDANECFLLKWEEHRMFSMSFVLSFIGAILPFCFNNTMCSASLSDRGNYLWQLDTFPDWQARPMREMILYYCLMVPGDLY